MDESLVSLGDVTARIQASDLQDRGVLAIVMLMLYSYKTLETMADNSTRTKISPQ